MGRINNTDIFFYHPLLKGYRSVIELDTMSIKLEYEDAYVNNNSHFHFHEDGLLLFLASTRGSHYMERAC